MKKLNRLFALSLAMLMCVCLVFATSCGDKDNTSSTEDPISSESEYVKSDYEVFDMQGETINILGFYSIIATGETATTEAGVLSIERRKEIETTYNCTFNMEVVSQQDTVAQEVSAAHMSGDVRADVFCCFTSGMRSMSYKGLLYPMSDVIDVSRPQWNDYVTEIATRDGKAYFLSPDPTNIESLVKFRPKYLDTYGIENPYDLIKEGKWTTDKYLEIAQKITQLGASSGVYGANKVTNEPSLSHVLALFGTYWVGRDEDGFFYSNLDDPKIIEALNWLTELNKCAPPDNASDVVSVFSYPAGNTGFGNVSVTDPAQEKVVYFCEAPLSQYITEAPNLCQAANVRGMSSLLTEERAKQVGTIYSRYCEPLGGSVEESARIDRADWEAKTYNQESADVIIAMREKGSKIQDWHLSGGIWDIIDKPVSAAIRNQASYASVIDSIKDSWESYLEDRNKEMDK